MTDEHVPNLKMDLAGKDRSRRHLPETLTPRHAMRTWRNFQSAVLVGDRHQAKACNQHIRRQKEIRMFGKQRALVIDMKLLVFGAFQWYIAAPLIRDYSVVHYSTRNE